MKKIRIITTLGPSSISEEIVKKMDLSGADIFRINLSHTDPDEFEKLVESVRKWTNKPIALDTEGAQLRTSKLPTSDGTQFINTHDIVTFVGCNSKNYEFGVPINQPIPTEVFRVGDLIKIDFNSVIVQAINVDNNNVIGRVIVGGLVGTNKGISIDRKLLLPSFSEKDIEAIKISSRLGIDIVFLSFCSCANDVIELRKLFNTKVEVISKIESASGLENLKEICNASDEVLIDRGDLTRDVPLEKITFAQSYIINQARKENTPVNVATNLMESMIINSKPTRAEINDIVNTIKEGAAGLVLAAETAIGKYPVDAVRILSRTINELFERKLTTSLEYLLEPPSDRIIEPHGGKLIQQFDSYKHEFENYPILELSNEQLSDFIQIAMGTYSPINGYMDQEEVFQVLEHNRLNNGHVWTMPILLQIKEDQISKIPTNGLIAVKGKASSNIIGILKVSNKEKVNNQELIASKWFGTNDYNHPGVAKFINGGEFIISGEPYLIIDNVERSTPDYNLSPKQTREIFNHNGWHNIVGFHTRNVVHRGHEYIQMQALKLTKADAIFISPVTGIKKAGDFTSDIILRCYQKTIQDGIYHPYNVILGSFSTYSRYCGPREAVFTALCRKNYGCNFFIIGRDHTGVGSYYKPKAAREYFDNLDTGLTILHFDEAFYCKNRKTITTESIPGINHQAELKISGTIIREAIEMKKDLPQYILRPEILSLIKQRFNLNPDFVFEN